MQILIMQKLKNLLILVSLNPIIQYIMQLYKTGIRVAGISSVKILAEKYELTLYIPLLTSRKNTGLSHGKIYEIAERAENPLFKVMKNRAPFLS